VTTGIVLMTYGAPRDADDVPAYLGRVRGGNVSDELVREMTRRYRIIGGSPLVRITAEQAAALERELGEGFQVRAAMRFSEPTIERVVAELAPQVDELVGVVLSPQWSDHLMGGYLRSLEAALGRAAPEVEWRVVRAWHDEPLFHRVVASALRLALAGLDRPAILLTAHSLPRRVYEAEPEYVAQLRATAEAVAATAGLAETEWSFAYQSAGHTQEEWLRPDLVELFPAIAASGRRDVLVVPVQFLADHLEVLYDLDVAARAQAEAHGLAYHRVAMPNDRPELARALAAVVRRELAAAKGAAPTP
jgi:protoporphyrin/coproporphyrin ferrochelatase